MKIEAWLKGKTAGLPNWAWVTLVGGAVAVGLYLRSRSASEEGDESGGTVEPNSELESFNGTESGAGLAAAGLVGPASSTLTPVETPFIPDSVTQLIEQLGTTIQSQSETIGDIKNTQTEFQPLPAEITGGGAPAPTPVHTPPPGCSKEISRLEGEIDGLQKEIASLTAKIQNAKGAKKPNNAQIHQLEAQRNQAGNGIQYKRVKLGSLKVVCR